MSRHLNHFNPSGDGAKTCSESVSIRTQGGHPSANDAATEQTGIGPGQGAWHLGTDTLYLATKSTVSGSASAGKWKNAVVWSSADKFGVVLETAHMNEAELAEYCRSKGLFVEQVADWREACQQANAAPAERNRELRDQGKSDRNEIKQLKKDLQRKEKALAEAAALIILRKKAQAIWGEPEDD